jgi:hypothetical protein
VADLDSGLVDSDYGDRCVLFADQGGKCNPRRAVQAGHVATEAMLDALSMGRLMRRGA